MPIIILCCLFNGGIIMTSDRIIRVMLAYSGWKVNQLGQLLTSLVCGPVPV
jgi:hypothetical protein